MYPIDADKMRELLHMVDEIMNQRMEKLAEVMVKNYTLPSDLDMIDKLMANHGDIIKCPYCGNADYRGSIAINKDGSHTHNVSCKCREMT